MRVQSQDALSYRIPLYWPNLPPNLRTLRSSSSRWKRSWPNATNGGKCWPRC